MTDEQRKQFIEEQIEIFPADCEMGEFLRDMAKLQSCGDAISRSDAIRIASGYCHWTNIPDELAKLPSVNTEKTGRWRRGFGNTSCTCSECGGNGESVYKFCHWCGARMIEPQESEK